MAAQFEITFTLGANSVTQTSASYSDANGQRFSDWIWAAYPQFDVDGNPLPDTAGNRAQSFRDWADAIFAGTKSNVLRWEQQEAASTAAGNVPPIDPE